MLKGTQGNYAQLVWKNSKRLEVSLASSRSDINYVVATYLPVGNIIGRFHRNVFPEITEGNNIVEVRFSKIPNINRAIMHLGKILRRRSMGVG